MLPSILQILHSHVYCLCFHCRLLDLGFEAKVGQIVEALDKQNLDRQTVLLSATLTEGG